MARMMLWTKLLLVKACKKLRANLSSAASDLENSRSNGWEVTRSVVA